MYSVKELFKTLQGEGMNVGVPSVFVRFAGCNIWSGFEADRKRDKLRTGAMCPTFCDTDFIHGSSLTCDQLVGQIEQVARHGANRYVDLVVLTGGEPLLQIDEQLLVTIKETLGPDTEIQVETNGTLPFKPGVRDLVDWLTVSPKLPPEKLALRSGDELKVVFPAYDPLVYNVLQDGFRVMLVSPEATPLVQLGQQRFEASQLVSEHVKQAVEFCLANPNWSLSFQLHKVLNIP